MLHILKPADAHKHSKHSQKPINEHLRQKISINFDQINLNPPDKKNEEKYKKWKQLVKR